MTKWKLDPAGIEGVLNKTLPAVQELEEVLNEEDIESIAERAYVKSLTGEEVVKALGNVLSGQQDNITNVFSTIQAGMLGVTNATISYNNGQTDMAETFQSEMVSAAESGDLTYLTENNQAV
ncbi:MAG: DUF6507 family protein [Canibacter sp.]